MSTSGNEIQFIRAAQLFDGDVMREGFAVGIEGTRIVAVCPAGELASDATIAMDAAIVAAGFVDLQVNGGGGVLFNDAPTPATLSRIARAARQGGTVYLFPTFLTAPGRAYTKALEAVEATDCSSILGIHLEGPFLSPQRPGIHPATAMRAPDAEDVATLTAPRKGPRLVTLAPEAVSPETIAALAAAGVTVFAGHTEADPATLARAASAGLSGFTHLFNAMPPVAGRLPGPVGTALTSDALYASIIADAHHVDPVNLALAARAKGAGRLILVTDAMASAGAANTTSFAFAGQVITLQGGRLTDPHGRLAGAHLAMDQAVATMVRRAGVPLADALRMASTTPAEAIGMGRTIGRVRHGYRAGLTMLDASLNAIATMVDGRLYPS